MSELKWNWVYYPYLDAPNEQEESALKAGYIKVVDKSEADKVISEKDKQIAELKSEIRRKEAVEQRWFEQCMEARSEAIRLKRALWLARAYRSRDNSILLPSKFMRNVWDNVERKCRAKAEEYGG